MALESISTSGIRQLAYRFTHGLRRVHRVLSSPYARMIFDVGLEDRFAKRRPPAFSILSEDREFVELEVEKLRIWWPREYSPAPVPSLYLEIFGSPKWNPHVYDYGRVRIKQNSWVLDAGSCEGFFIHYALKHGAKVVAVEPVAILARALERTFESEIAQQNVKIIHGALGARTGVMRLHIPESTVYCASLSDAGTQQVQVYSLDDIWQRGLAPSVDFVKMDIEGGEIEAIEGAASLLRERRPMLAIAVYHAQANAYVVKNSILRCAPEYEIRWRGLWTRDGSAPRPYMLHASV